MKILYSFIACVLFVLGACTPERHQERSSVDARIDSLISIMTLDEKVGQLTLYTSDLDVTGAHIREGYVDDLREGKVGAIFNAIGADYTRKLQQISVDETRLGIPLLFGYDVVHGYKTIFPIPLGETASWDLTAMELSARIAAEEASSVGLHWTFAPMVDISRDPRWGRIMEGSGEDTYLGVQAAIARVKGFQGDDLAANNTVLACVKHFAAYGAAQAGRDYNTVDISERSLREDYLPPFKAAIDAGVGSIMTSFNEYDGVPASGNRFLLTDILQKEWGFTGFVVTDYTSILEMLQHGIAADTLSATRLSFDAGVDMDMQSGFFEDKLGALVNEKVISEESINKAVRKVLKKKYALGLFEDPYRYSDATREKETLMKPAFIEAARDIARKSIVLLKNTKQTLPLPKSVKKIAVIGPLGNSTNDLIGAWSGQGEGKNCISLLAGIQAASAGTVVFAKGCNINDDSLQYIAESVKVARTADVVVLALGEAAWMSGEAASRSNIELPGVQQRLANEIFNIGKPVVVVLMNGRPLAIPELDRKADAILETWFLGTQAGHAIADVLFGDYNPSGKLPVSFPISVGQVPIYYNQKNTGRPFDANNKYTSKYLDVANEPLYPFGYGLSYSQFDYGEIMLSKNEMAAGDTLTLKCIVKNVGQMDGEEVVQLYVRDLVGSVTRPVKELIGFQKIMIKAGESKELIFEITASDLSFYRLDMTYGAEPGNFQVFLGGNSRDTKAAAFSLK